MRSIPNFCISQNADKLPKLKINKIKLMGYHKVTLSWLSSMLKSK